MKVIEQQRILQREEVSSFVNYGKPHYAWESEANWDGFCLLISHVFLSTLLVILSSPVFQTQLYFIENKLI